MLVATTNDPDRLSRRRPSGPGAGRHRPLAQRDRQYRRFDPVDLRRQAVDLCRPGRGGPQGGLRSARGPRGRAGRQRHPRPCATTPTRSWKGITEVLAHGTAVKVEPIA